MKLAISIILIIAALLYVAGLKIQFNPFKIEFTSLKTMIGWILICIGLVFLQVQVYTEAYKKGCKDMTEEIITYLKENKTIKEE